MLMDEEQVKKIRKEYPKGTKVELVFMDDFQSPPVGTKGVVSEVDDMGVIHVKWENGSNLGVVYGVDTLKKAE